MYALSLIFCWLIFIVSVCNAEAVDHSAFFYFSAIMFFVTYYLNFKKNITMSLQVTIFFLSIPSSIYWFVFIVHNRHFKLDPFSYEFVIFIMLLYFYAMLYVFSEYKNNL